MKKALFSLLAAAVAAAVPVHAATFVKDVMLIGHPDEDEIAALKSTYTGQGWTVIDQDLNAGAGGDYIYLLCRFEANPDNVNDGYITDFAVYTEGGTVPESQTYDGRDYRLVPFAGGQHFTERQGDLNSNAGGASIHLYYTKDAFPDDRAVTNVWFGSSSSGAVGKFGETSGYDLNQDAGGDYIYMHAPAAHSPLGLTVNGLDIAYASGTGWTFDGATVSLTNAGPFVLSTGGANFTSNVAVVAQADCAVTFSNLEVFAGNHAGLSPFTVAPGVSVALALEGNTVLTAGSGAAAITVVSNATGVASLTIDADASDTLHTLGANGGNQGAGIGGGNGEACGSVTILGGLLTVEGGANAAGIGGGRNGAGGTVTISGGRLNVKSAGSYAFVGGQLKTTNGGAAIGGGYQAAGGSTAISGGTMSLTGVGGGADIGPGKDGAGGTTAITGGSILARGGAVEPSPSNGVARVWPVAVSNLTAGAAIELPWLPATYGTNDLVAVGGEICVWLPTGDYLYGAGESDGEGGIRRHAVLVDAEGNVTFGGWVSYSPLGLTVNGLDIAYASGTGWTFDGATVSLVGAGPFVLSTGGANFTSNVAVVAQADCAVTFSNLEVFAGNHAGLSPFTVAPGVSVALSLDGNTVLRAGSGAAAITVVSNATGVASLTIDADASDTFHTLGATGGNQGAGIGGGDGEACGSVTILGGLLTVEGGANAAGIGGGRNGAGGTVTISGGRLNVKSAGSYAFIGGKLTSVNGGAAIGGGYQAAGGSTAISGGTISLTGVGDGAAIGPGKDGAGGMTAITGGSILARGGAVEPSPSNGVARVWPVAVSNLTAGAAIELPWLPADYGTNDLVAVGGEACVWLPTGDYAYGEAESDGEGGIQRHAVLVDAEGNVTLDGWVTFPLLGLTVNGRDIAFESGAGWSFDGATVSLSGAGPFVLSTAGETFSNDVGIVAAANCAVTFSNLVMDASANNDLSPFTVTPGTETALTLVGTNSLAAGESAAGLAVVKNGDTVASLVIDAADTNQTLSATGGQDAAGIGGGVECSGGTVTISDGAVTATGGFDGAGIGGGGGGGGGFGGAGGMVTISGGTVTATGRGRGAGIGGGGGGGAGGTVAISGGMVTAKGSSIGAGIGGGGDCGSGGTVTISGGVVTATAAWTACGIGAGGPIDSVVTAPGPTCGPVEISGGTVVARAGTRDYGDIGGWSGNGGSVTFTGGSIRAFSGKVWNAPSNGEEPVWCVMVTNLAPNAAVSLSGLPAGYGTDDIFADATGKAYLWLPNGDYEFTANGTAYIASVKGANATATVTGRLTVNGRNIAFTRGLGWNFDGATVSLSGAGPFVLSTAGETFSNDVGIVAAANCAVTFSNLVMDASANNDLSPFTVTPGTETALTLMGTNSLAAGRFAAGLTVVSNATGAASLVIGAADTNQTLTATGGDYGAGIGGGDECSGGTVTIIGGAVSATGGDFGAGIGGGGEGSGGMVTISGGTVTATGGYQAGGIGGGRSGAGGTVAISGGAVTATGGDYGAGIGGGNTAAGGVNTFTGGSILAASVVGAPSNGVARVWPVSVTGLADGAAPSLPWLPATYGTNDLVAVGGEVCVWLPTGGYPYGEAESDGAGGMRRHAVLVDAEGNVTLDGWVTVSPLSLLTITGFALAPDGTATIAFGGDGDLAAVSDSLAVDVSATPDFATLLAPASTNLAISGATGTFTVSPPASAPPTLFFRVRVP